MNPPEVRRAAARALVAAQQVFRRLGWDQTEPIDVFRLIVEEGITLYFKPFKRLAGAYIPATSDRAPLITINEGHPLALQRYTAAHEFGHHSAQSDATWDEDVEPLARGGLARTYAEAYAEAFAAWLLMPRQLVAKKWRELEIPAEVHAEHVYRLSLEFGTSYDATLTQLRVLRLLTTERYRALRKVPPKSTKEQIAGEARPNPRADVWALGDWRRNQVIRAKVDDEIILDLTERPTTGYMWEPIDWPSEAVRDVRSDFSPTPRSVRMYDAPGRRRLRFTLASPGRWRLVLVLRSPYAPDPADQRQLTLEVVSPLRGPYVELDELALPA